MKKNVIITGATGMVGNIVLRECLESDDIGEITSILRRPSGISHPKLKEIVHNDFTNYTDLAKELTGHDIAYFCIGVYTGQVSDDEFKKITVDYTIAFVDALKANSPDASFCFLSGEGADLQEKSKLSFAKYKGMAENYLMKKELNALYIFRPAYIYPVQKRKEPNFGYTLGRWLYPLLKRIYPNGVITSEQLGKAMFKAGLSGAEKTILGNVDIKKI